MSDYLASGRLEDHPFADLAGLIFREGRTGELTLESGDRRRSVWFLGGNPVALVSDDPQDHLAQFLLEHGKISEDDARRLAGMAETREALGTADFLPKETLSWGVKSRFVNLCYDLFRWEEGDYAFHQGEPPRELFLLKVPAHSLVFKGVGFIGQAGVREAVPDEAVCGPGPVSPADARYLSPDVRKLLEDCRPGRTVGEVIGSGWDDADQARRLLYALVCLGLVSLARGPAAAGALDDLDASPSFTFDEDAGGAAAPAALSYAGEAAVVSPTPEEFTLAQEGRRGEFDLDLPPLDTSRASPAASAAALDLSGEGLSGGYALEDEPGGGSFGAFGSGMTLDSQDALSTAAEEADDAPVPTRTRPGRRFPLPRIAGIVLGSLVAAGLIGFAAWWWLADSEPPAPPVKPPQTRPAAVPPPPIAPPAAPEAAAPAPASTPPAAPSPATAPAAPAVPAPAASPAPLPVPAPKPPSAAAAAGPTPDATDRYRNGLEVFRAGDLDGAAAIWESLLAEEHRDGFTLLLLTACQRDTVRDAQRALAAQQVYLVSKKVDGRNCFRVCVGTYASREAAGRALTALPQEYRAAGAAVRPVADVLRRER